MSNQQLRTAVAALTVVVTAGLCWPAAASAQWRGPGPYPYPYGLQPMFTGAVRVQATPREAEVFVDGYRAGIVNDFDGIFQRLRVPAGGHRITLYLDGFRTESHDVYVEPGGDVHLKVTMEALPAGEAAEPPPAPEDVAVADPPGVAGPDVDERPAREPPAPREAFGALALRLTPADAQVRIDGEVPEIFQGRDGPLIRLAAGEHTVTITREGYQPYTERVLIQRGRTLTLAVTLVR